MSEMENESTEPGQAPVTPPEPAPVAPDPPALLPIPAESAPPPAGWWVPPSTPPAAPAPDNSLWHRIAAAVVLVAVVAAAFGIGIGFSLAHVLSTRTAQTQTQTQPGSPIQATNPSPGSSQNGSVNLAAIAAKVDPAIVDINTVLPNGNAAGTGMILTSSGLVLTNNHVVDGSTSIAVNVAGHSQTYVAHVVGVDRPADIALIQLEGASGLSTVNFARSSSLQVGDVVVALGNALGQGGSPSVTQGTITALDQTITASEGGSKSETLTGLIQSDATISQGDSGGPLVNKSGQVVGMITAGQAQGFRAAPSIVDYAIPSDTLVSVVNRIRSGQASPDIIYGQIGYIGVSVQTLTADLATNLGLNISSGGLVVSVQADSPASAVGITRNSVITSLAGTAITSTQSLGAELQTHKPGEQVAVTWVNQGGTHSGTLTLGAINP